METRWTAVVLGVAFLVALFASPSPASGGEAGPAPAETAILNIGGQDQMKTRNLLASMNDPFTMAVLARVYDTPVQRDATTGAVVPRLAVGIDQDGDGVLDTPERGDFTVPGGPTVTVFYDFSNARFHDGVPVTIGSVLFSYHILALNPDLSAPTRPLMNASQIAADRWLWVLPVDDGDGNASTAALRFTPTFRYADFAWATLGIPILPRHLFEGTGGGRHPVTASCPDTDWGLAIYPESDPRFGQGVPTSETTYRPFNYPCAEMWQMTDADVVGSGHFQFNSWSFGVFTRLDANLDYAFGRPRVDAILFKIYRTTQLGVFALQSGDIDYYNWNVPPEFIPDLRNHPNIRVIDAPPLFPATLFFNLRRQPFGYVPYPPSDPRIDDVGLPFRQAFAHLVDRETMVRVLLQDYGVVADGMIAPTNDGWHNVSLTAPAYDPASAATILDNAGWIDTDADGWREFPRLGNAQFRILTPQADFDPILASAGAMIANTARSIGINLISQPTAFGAILQSVNARNFDLAILSYPEVQGFDPWTLLRGDPDYLFDLFHSSRGAAGRNHAGLFDAPYDAIIEAASVDSGFAVRSGDVHAAESLLADRLPFVPMFYRNQTSAYRYDRYQGWKVVASTVMNYWSLQDIRQVFGPQAAFTATPNPVQVGVTVTFDGSASSDPDGTVVAYDWTFGDGANGTGVSPTHVYASPGLYWATLRVTDNDGLVSSGASAWITVTRVTEPPVASFTATPNPAEVGAPVAFDASGSYDPDGTIVSYAWDFGEGSVGSGVVTSHTYTSPGNYTVSLVVTDNTSAQDTATVLLVVTPNLGPRITLVSPLDGAIIQPGTDVDLDVVDDDLVRVEATFDGAYSWYLDAPYDVSTLNWSDDAHTLEVSAVDSQSSETVRSFAFTLDSIAPIIILESPPERARIRAGTLIDFSVADPHLWRVAVSLDGDWLQPFPAPYDFRTDGLDDGDHTIGVRAEDLAGNWDLPQFRFTLDSTPPVVTDRTPEGAVSPVPSEIRVNFSEAMNTASVEAAFSLSDGVRTWTAGQGTFIWSSDRTSFAFRPDGILSEGRLYNASLAGTLMDEAGNELGQDVVWAFTTPASERPSAYLWMYASVVAALAAAVVAVLLLFARRRKRRDGTAKGKP